MRKPCWVGGWLCPPPWEESWVISPATCPPPHPATQPFTSSQGSPHQLAGVPGEPRPALWGGGRRGLLSVPGALRGGGLSAPRAVCPSGGAASPPTPALFVTGSPFPAR